MAEPARTTLKLSLPDQISSVKRLLENVLAEFDVTYEWSKQTSHVLSVEIWVSNKRLTHTYTHVDYRVGFDARADLRRKLMSVNAPLKKMPLPRTPEPESFGGVPISIPVAADRPRQDHRATLLSTVAMIDSKSPGTSPSFIATSKPEVSVSESPTPPRETVATQGAPPDPQPQAVFPDPPAANSVTIDSRTVYQSVMLAPAEVMVIEVANDLMVPKGDVLVIPLHDTSLYLHMPKAQFMALFRQSEKPAPEPQIEPPAPPPPPVEPVVHQVVPETRVEAPPRPELVTAVQPEPPASKSVPKAPPVAPPPLPPKSPFSGTFETIDPEVRSVDGITAQVGRHMNAIAYMQNVTKQDAVAVRDLTGLLDARDHKQVSARMPVAAKLGFARRVDSRDGKPLQYGLTASGHQLIARMQTWPWKREGLPVPEWANYSQ